MLEVKFEYGEHDGGNWLTWDAGVDRWHRVVAGNLCDAAELALQIEGWPPVAWIWKPGVLIARRGRRQLVVRKARCV
jgi:hypothetical protein